MTSKSNTYDYAVFSRAVHITYLNSSCTSDAVRVASLGVQKRVWPWKCGSKMVWSGRGSPKGTRGRALESPVVASVEVQYDMKENRILGVRGRSSLENFFDQIL